MIVEDLGLCGLKVYQDEELYRFTSDSVLLSKFARVKKGDVVADFCAGSGIVGFNLYGLNKDLIENVTFFELQKPMYDLSVKSIELNGLSKTFSAVNCGLQDLDKEYYGKFSLVVCNPPYMDKNSGEHDKDSIKAICKTELKLSLKELLFSISRALKFGGRACLVHRADRLCEVLCGMREQGIEPKRLALVNAKNKEPYLFLVEGVKGGKSGMKVLSNVENV